MRREAKTHLAKGKSKPTKKEELYILGKQKRAKGNHKGDGGGKVTKQERKRRLLPLGRRENRGRG